MGLNKLLRFLKVILFYLIDSILSHFNESKYNKNVIFVKTDNLGDLICWITIYKKFLSNKEIKNSSLVIINEKWLTLVKDLNLFKEILPVNTNLFRSSIIYRIKILFKVRRISCNFLINPTRSRAFLTDDTLSRFIKSKEKIRFENDDVHMTWYENIISNFQDFTEIKIKYSSEHLNHNYFLDYINKRFFRLKLKNINIINNKKKKNLNIISIVPGASSPLREYGHKNFVKLGKYIYDNYKSNVYFLGTKDEYNKVELECNKLQFKNAINLCGKTNLNEYISKLEKSRLIISNESSAAQIALYKNIEHICIMGGGHFGRFISSDFNDNISHTISQNMDCFNCNWNCKFSIKKNSPFKCISDINFHEVIETINRVLKK